MAKGEYPENGDNTPAARAQRETYWRRIVERWKASGLPKTAFCERESIGQSAFHWWVGELRRRDGKAAEARRPRRGKGASVARTGFVPVRVVPLRSSKPAPIEVVVCGQVIRVVPDFDPETFLRLVAVLQGEPLAREVTLEDGRC